MFDAFVATASALLEAVLPGTGGGGSTAGGAAAVGRLEDAGQRHENGQRLHTSCQPDGSALSHPARLDAATHVLSSLPRPVHGKPGGLLMPVGIRAALSTASAGTGPPRSGDAHAGWATGRGQAQLLDAVLADITLGQSDVTLSSFELRVRDGVRMGVMRDAGCVGVHGQAVAAVHAQCRHHLRSLRRQASDRRQLAFLMQQHPLPAFEHGAQSLSLPFLPCCQRTPLAPAWRML